MLPWKQVHISERCITAPTIDRDDKYVILNLNSDLYAPYENIELGRQRKGISVLKKSAQKILKNEEG